MQYRRLLRQEIDKVAGGEKPFMFLDAAHARSIQGPATMDGIGPTRGWETYWMEVDVKRRRGAPWAAPVPEEIAEQIRHLSAAMSDLRHCERSEAIQLSGTKGGLLRRVLLAMTAVSGQVARE